MGSDTLLLEWEVLHKQLQEANVNDQENCYTMLKEHEEHMVAKGFTIRVLEILSPQGVTVWTHTS